METQKKGESNRPEQALTTIKTWLNPAYPIIDEI